MSDFTLLVNAGGVSARMGGQPKALLPVPPRATPLINMVIDRLSPLATTGVVVVANDAAIAQAVSAAHPDAMILPDAWPDRGAMGGIATGLAHCPMWAMIVACDMPFVSAVVYGAMIQHAKAVDAQGERRWDAVVPRIRGYPQMLHALYHAALLPAFAELIQAGNLKLLDILPAARVRYVTENEIVPLDPELLTFTNVNTREEWANALRRLR